MIRGGFQGADAKGGDMRHECGSAVQFYHDARLFDEVAMAQKVRPYDGEATRRKEVHDTKNCMWCL